MRLDRMMWDMPRAEAGEGGHLPGSDHDPRLPSMIVGMSTGTGWAAGGQPYEGRKGEHARDPCGIAYAAGCGEGSPVGKPGEERIMPTLRRRVEITNGPGLHLRAADQFVRECQQFQAEVRVFCNGHVANGRSILGLLSLAAECGARLELEVSGPDANEAAAALCKLVEARFQEAANGRDELSDR